jgi:hypothetical protein
MSICLFFYSPSEVEKKTALVNSNMISKLHLGLRRAAATN